MDAKVFTTALEGLSENDRAKVMAYIQALQNKPAGSSIPIEKQSVLNDAIHNLPFDIWITDTSFHFIAVNQTASEKLYQEIGMIAQPGQNLLKEIEKLPPGRVLFWRDALERALTGETTHKNYEYQSVHTDNVRYVELRVAPYYDTEGNIIGCIGSNRDITEIQLQQEAILEREQIYKTIIDHARAGIDIIDVSNFDQKDYHTATLFDRNSKMADYLQSDTKLFITKSEVNAVFENLQFNNRTSDQIFDQLNQGLFDERSFHEVFRLKSKTGKYHDIDALVRLIIVNEKMLLIRLFRDITEELHKKKLIDEQIAALHQQNETLQRYIESNVLLENFAYIAAHDLQAPIRSISSYTKILERSLFSKLSKDERYYFDFVISSAKSMQRLIGDLLEYSRANTQKLKPTVLSLVELKAVIEKNLSIDLKEKNATVSWDISSDKIVADHTKLLQILENLINNASKFTSNNKAPEIQIRMEEKPNAWQFTVSDNGIGIDKEYHEQIFTLFRRLHAQNEYQGTGIGLPLCKQLVEQHNGQIWVKSSKRKGSTFYFTIAKNIQE